MTRYEYRVIPAPKQGLKARGVKGTEAQFAHALTTLMNEAAAEGWDYQRTDTLPCEERQGFGGRTTVFQNMLVFRRLTAEAAASDLRAAAATADAQRRLFAAPQIAPQIAPQTADRPVVNAPVAPQPAVAATPPSPEPVAARVMQTLAAGNAAPMVLRTTPDLRADPTTRMAAE